MHWIAAALLSALFLGVYELCTKHAVHKNAVLPVLFLANCVSAARTESSISRGWLA